MKELETGHLRLRKLREDDAEAMFANWANDPEVTRYLTWKPHKNVAETQKWLERWVSGVTTHSFLGIVLKETDALIGMVDVKFVRPEVGYMLSRAHWGKGYMTEALEAVSTYLFEEGFGKIYIESLASNIGSIRVNEKNGFEFYGTKVETIKGAPATVNCYVKENPQANRRHIGEGRKTKVTEGERR